MLWTRRNPRLRVRVNPKTLQRGFFLIFRLFQICHFAVSTSLLVLLLVHVLSRLVSGSSPIAERDARGDMLWTQRNACMRGFFWYISSGDSIMFRTIDVIVIRITQKTYTWCRLYFALSMWLLLVLLIKHTLGVGFVADSRKRRARSWLQDTVKRKLVDFAWNRRIFYLPGACSPFFG